MKKNNKNLVIGGGAVVVIAVVALLALGGTEPVLVAEAQLYKSSMCGCCGTYADYAEKSLDLQVIEQDDITDIKDGFGIPATMRSCHTTVIEGYFVEGHVPIEAIEKLLNERPDIKGIALPGMPAGVPGMPGQKQGLWVVYAVANDGSVSEFLKV